MSSFILFGFVPNWMVNWLTPVWIIGVGVLAGLALCLIAWGVLFLLSKASIIPSRYVLEIPLAIKEGPLLPILITALALAAFGVIGSFIVRDPLGMLGSMARWPSISREPAVSTYTIPVITEEQIAKADDLSDLRHAIEVVFSSEDMRELVFSSTEPLKVTSHKDITNTKNLTFSVSAGENYVMISSSEAINPFGAGNVRDIYVQNLGEQEATLQLTVVTERSNPELSAIPITAISLLLVFLLYLVQRSAMPKLSAVSLTTLKSETAQPLFPILMVLGVVILTLFIFLSYNTLGDDIKVLKDSGLTLIMFFCIIQAVWAASTTISDEIDGKTALTVLSKPISRRSFILGKFLGIVWTVAVMVIILGVFFMLVIAYKPIYDAKESSAEQPIWQVCFFEMIRIVPGLVLVFFETVVIAAISVAISTRLPQLANGSVCFAIYVLGHLTPLLVQSSAGQFEIVAFFGQFISTVFPVLDHFNIQASISTGAEVPHAYLGWALVYCLLYSTIMMLLALIMFEDRDLA